MSNLMDFSKPLALSTFGESEYAIVYGEDAEGYATNDIFDASDWPSEEEGNKIAAELVKRWNAYPELVEAFKETERALIAFTMSEKSPALMAELINGEAHKIRAILAKVDSQEGGR